MTEKRDPATADFWDAMFRQNRMPWDAAATPPEVERYLAQETGAGRRVLIPGCGMGYEVCSFAEKGYEVTAIDFSVTAVQRAKALVGSWQDFVLFGDFFSYDFAAKPFDVIYERAFLASLPKDKWRAYARRVAELLRPEGELVGFFVYSEQDGGPPFCLHPGDLSQLLGDKFGKVSETAVTTSVPVFAGKERWEIWRRTK
jgi:SAM-dependent methyltransferase